MHGLLLRQKAAKHATKQTKKHTIKHKEEHSTQKDKNVHETEL